MLGVQSDFYLSLRKSQDRALANRSGPQLQHNELNLRERKRKRERVCVCVCLHRIALRLIRALASQFQDNDTVEPVFSLILTMDIFSNTPPSSRPCHAVASGVQHQRAGRTLDALRCYERALSLDQRNVDALVARGTVRTKT